MATTMLSRDRLQRAAGSVLGYAAAISLVHLAQGIGLILALGMPPLTGFALKSVLLELALATVVGLLLSPLTLARRGEWLFPAAATLVFIGMERVVAVDPSRLQMWIAPSLVAFVVFALGRRLWRWRPPVVLAALAALPAFFLSLPVVAESLRERGQAEVATGGEAPEGAPDVLMIVMDTVRAQSLSTYGYERDTSPNLDRLAAEGVLFLDANAPATWSLPAHAALFTGTFPSWNNANGETRYLDGRLPTLAELLAQGGWETRAFTANPHISEAFGLTRGFRYDDRAWMAGTSGRNFSFIYRMVDALGLGGVDDKGGARVVDNIARWMEQRPEDDGPAFVFVNFLEAHFPFRQLPEPFRNAYQAADPDTLRQIDQIAFGVQFGRQLTPEEMAFVHQPLIDLYDGGVKYTDHLVGEVIDVWREAGRLDDTVVIVLGDHGEVVGEHGAFGHVTPVLEPDLRVPLVIRYPERIEPGTRVEEPVSTAGTLATILDLVGLPPSPVAQVGSLLEVVKGDPFAGMPILAERFEEHMLAARFAPGTANGTGPLVNPRGRYRTYRSGRYKLVQHSTDGWFLYDLEADPGETTDLAGDDPATLARLQRELEDWRVKLGLPELDAPVDAPREMPATLTEAERAALEALGYLDGGG